MSLILLATTTIVIVFNVRKQNYIDDLNTAIENAYSSFECAESRTEKYNVLNEFISSAESYSKYNENEENYNTKLDDMKAALLASYETELTKNMVTVSDDITKEELNTLNINLSTLKSEIEADEVTSTESIISKIDAQIKIYKDKIAELEAAEEAAKKAEEERFKKEAEAKKKEEVKKNDYNSNSNGNNNSSKKENNSNSQTSNSSKFNTNGMRKTWDIAEDGSIIPGSIRYQDKNGCIYDENGHYLGSLSEWATDW